MPNNIIDYNDSGIVAKETRIQLSDEKLKSMLSRTYEHAQIDMSKFSFSKCFSFFLSVAATLLLSLITSEFKAIGQVSAECVTTIVWIIFAATAVLGFFLMGLHVFKKTHTDTTQRDNAVNDIFDEYFSQ